MNTQPVLPLDTETTIAVRNMRIIAANMRASTDRLVASDASALDDLADALERSLNHTNGI